MTPPTLPLVARIEKIVAGGLGLARLGDGGKIALVEDAAPGDLLELTVLREYRDYLRARPAAVREAGPGRRTAPCPHAARCGGCTLQHLTYDAQVDAKLAIVRESLARVAHIEVPEPFLAHRSPEWGYRRRARFHVGTRGSRVAALGFRERRGSDIVDLEVCPVLTPALERALPGLRARARGRRELSVADDGTSILVEGDAAQGRVVAVAGERVPIAPDVFFQANAPLLERMVERVLALATAGGERDLVRDLYAGVGLFTLPLARHFARVDMVERSRQSLALGSQAIARAGMSHVRPLAMPVADYLRAARGERGGVAVADPPREGLGTDVCHALAALTPGRIVYVSCDPVTLARDVAALTGNGYRVASVELLDLFPQTHHIETITLLEHQP